MILATLTIVHNGVELRTDYILGGLMLSVLIAGLLVGWRMWRNDAT